MVVWVAVRLARLATVAKNLHSQRRFSAMQASRPAHTSPWVRGCAPGCLPAWVCTSAPSSPRLHGHGRPTLLVRVCVAQTLDVDFAAEGSEDEGNELARP